jgi:all-trans-8'-apo-beta-carotenal 15,15'-oxygenase
MLTAITIKNGSAIFRNRFIRTKGYLKEKRTKRISYRGTFGTKNSGFYIITAIHHKVNKHEHTMTMEVIKDSLYVDKESTYKA